MKLEKKPSNNKINELNAFMLSFIENWTSIIQNYNQHYYKQNPKSKLKPFDPNILKKIKDISLFTGISESDLINMKKIAQNYRNKMIENNKRLVKKAVLDFVAKNNCEALKNVLYNSGLIALSQAIEAYKSIYEVNFSTYAYTTICNKINNDYLRETNIIRIPKYTIKNLQTRSTLKEDERISIKNMLNIKSLEETIEKRYNEKIEEVKLNSIFTEFRKSIYSTPESLIRDLEQSELINKLFSCLTKKEIEIIESIYGFKEESISMAECARRHNTTRQDIKSKMNRIFKKLRNYIKKNNINLEEYFDS